MDSFCGSPFWDPSLSWYTDDPELTPCFEKTVLIWIPCLFLWIFASFEIYYMLYSKNRNIPWNFLNISKLSITVLLIAVTIVDVIMAVQYITEEDQKSYKIDIYSAFLTIPSFILYAILVMYNRKYGIRTSGVQFLFWLLFVLCGTPQLISEIRKRNNGYFYVNYVIHYCLFLLLLLLNCFADRSSKFSKYTKPEKPCPEESASFLSRIFYRWFDKLTWRGFKKPLEFDDLWNLRYEDTAEDVYPQFEKHWEDSMKKQQTDSTEYRRAAFTTNSAQVNFASSSKKKEPVSIVPVLFKAFGSSFLFGAFLRLVQDILAFASPLILNLLLAYIENRGPDWHGFLYVACLFFGTTIQTLVVSQYFYRMHVVGIRVRTALIAAVYRKALKISSFAKKDTSTGEVLNLMQVDAQIFAELIPYLNMIWSAPLQITIAIYLLWQLLGPSVLAGVAVMVILIPINITIVNRVQVFQFEQMKNKDNRIKLMNEILGGIKLLKLYAWEPSFERRVSNIRKKEITVLKKAAFLNAGMALIFSLAPFLVALFTFIVYVNIDEENVLTPQRAFVSLTLFATMHFSMGVLPLVIIWVTESYVSVKRLNKFLNAEELDPNNVEHDSSSKVPISIENGNFSWGEDTILKNVNLNFEKNNLTAVVGGIGSGKSSLMSALLGEMEKISGRVNTVGSIAYVPQQAWIQNATLQDNITFGKSMDKDLYDKVIEACALKQDFDMLPAGDQTEIGEKGINLSGGQRQRISLARAVYVNADIYLLDDPLSAVDSHVGKHIFEQVIGPHGLLKYTTRILVTHGATYLPTVDQIIVLKDGEISETGAYQELLDKQGEFSHFLLQYVNQTVQENDDKGLDHVKEVSDEDAIAKQPGNDDDPEKGKKGTEATGEKLIDTEETQKESVKFAVFLYFFKQMGIFMSVGTVVFHILGQCFSVGTSIWLGVWSSDQETTASERDMYLGVYGALGFAQVVFVFLSAVTLYLGCLNASYALHNLLLSSIFRAPSNTFFDVTPIGRILNRFTKDVDVLDTSLPMIIKGWFSCLLSVLATLFVISYTTPIFIAVVIPISIMYYLVQRFYIATSRQLKRLESVSRSPIYSHFGETVSGSATIRAYEAVERFTRESEAKVDFNQVCTYSSIIAEQWLGVRLEMMGNLIILFASLFAVLDEETNAGLVGLSISYALQITQTLNVLVVTTSNIESNIVSVERIKEYGDTPSEAPWEIPKNVPAKTWPELGTINIENLSFRYRPGLDLVLKDINASIRSGEKVGIIGRTGSGKSSLTLALFRLIEAAQGGILIDGIDISKIGLHNLRSQLTVIPQDPTLFSGSLRMNLDPYEKYTDDEVWLALEHSHLKEYVKGLAAGLNHEVTEGGDNLSAGQRQLVCLSRALLRKSKILILDEATAAIDLETDDLIQEMIRKKLKACTILTIAHRLNTIVDSDRIMVLDEGQIAEFDSPTSLLEDKQSIFYGMAKDANLV